MSFRDSGKSGGVLPSDGDGTDPSPVVWIFGWVCPSLSWTGSFSCSALGFRYGVEQKGLTFDIDAKSTGGQTPLHIAAIHGHKNIIRLLVKKFGANVKLRDMAGKKPWQYLSDRSPDILQLLGAPPKAALVEEAGSSEPDWKPPKQRRRHHLSSASSAQRPRTVAQMVKVSRSSSIAALLKHKSHRF